MGRRDTLPTPPVRVAWEDGGEAGSMTAPDKCSQLSHSARQPRVPRRPSQDERPAGADGEAHGHAGQAGEQQRAAPDCQCGELSRRQVRKGRGGHRASGAPGALGSSIASDAPLELPFLVN